MILANTNSMAYITEERLLLTDPSLAQRPYQIKALQSIFRYDKCLVKMFCGTGKSRIITNTILHSNKDLSVAVFPSLALIHQYSSDYVATMLKPYRTLNVSSQNLETVVSTTDPATIQAFLCTTGPKLVLVTYQSYDVLLESLNGMKIGLVCYDEAHHVTSIKKQKLVFGTDYFEKEVFFTATPHNENGITMYDREEPEKNMCGELAYDYTYLQGLNDDFLNGFDICVDMYTENTNASIYEGMARAILARGTGRVLTFHSDVNNSESGTSVWNFVNLKEFTVAFSKVLSTEFPAKTLPKITFKGIDGNTLPENREQLLKKLNDTANEDIFILSSCGTLGEGVDTKRANMCVFADPKTSVTQIIQNIGRVVRKDVETPVSTIFIPCYVNMENYASANGDPEKQDELIREQMRAANGDYAPILNVLAAQKQEDEELYEQCLNYPSKTHKERSLNEQGFKIDEEDEDIVYTEEDVEQMKDDGEPLEIHTNDTIERFNEDNEDQPLTRLYYDEEEDTYKPIVKIDEDEDDDRQVIQPPKKQKRVGMSIHQNNDILMLWSVKGELDFSKKFCSVTIDCSVSMNVERWFENLEAVKLYMDTNNKSPSCMSKDPETKRLGKWVSTQKQNYNGNVHSMNNTTIRSAWEEFITDPKYAPYFTTSEEDWNANLTSVKQYADTNNKLPAKTSKDQETKRLYEWIQTQKKNYNGNIHSMKNTTIRSAWEAFITDPKYAPYFTTTEEDWKANLTAVKQYMDTNNTSPSSGSKDPETKRLGQWVSTQKQNYNGNVHSMNNTTIRSAWEEFITDPKYALYFTTSEEDWNANLTSVKQYADTNNKLPAKTSKDQETKRLDEWIQYQKKNYNGNIHSMKNTTIRSAWEAFITDPKYAQYFTTWEEDWYANLTAVKNYMDSNNKSPRCASKGPETKRLGKWVSTQKQNYNGNVHSMKNPEICSAWKAFITDPKYSPYFTTAEEDWYANLTAVKQYIDSNNKPPTQSSSHKEIKILGNWITAQKANYKEKKNNMSNPDILAAWKAFVTDPTYINHIISQEEQWFINLSSVRTYIDNNRASPTENLGRWIIKQRHSYIHRMKTPTIRSAWEEFITDPKYAPYINQSLQATPDTSESEPPVVTTTTPTTITLRPKPLSEPASEPPAEKPKIKITAKPKPKAKDPPKPKTYSELTEEERQKICERHLKKQAETKGYRSTNPDDKDTINTVFAQHINSTGNGMIIFLDHTEFKTAYALLEKGVRPEQMIIPQWPDNYADMSQHELFGSSVVLGDFNEVLQHRLESPDLTLNGIYADYCGTLQKDGLPFVELLSKYKSKLTPDAIIGVTLTLRNPEGVRFAGQDISMMATKLTRAFPAHENLFYKAGIIADDDGPYTYGGGAPMATWLISV